VREPNKRAECETKSGRRQLHRGRLLRLACGLGLLAIALALGAADPAGAGFYDRTGSGGERTSCTSQNLDQVELKTIFLSIAKELCTDSCAECGRPDKACGSAVGKGSDLELHQAVLVADFVDLQNYQPNQYGILMGELMRGSLNSYCCSKIIQAEFAKYFKLTESGLVVLTRNVSDIKTDKYSQPECIVGTFSFLNSKLIIFVRRINTTTGQISKMVMREIDFKCDQGKVSYTVY
jgi:hypothetical protein